MVQVPVDSYNTVLPTPQPTPYQDQIRPQQLEEAYGSGVSASVSNLSDALNRIDQANGRAQALAVNTQGDLDMQKSMQQAQMSAPPGAQGFTDSFIAAHNEYYSNAVKDVQNPYAQQAIQEHAQQSLRSFGEAAQTFQAKQQVALRQDQLTSSLDNMQQSLSIMSPQDADSQYPMVLQKYTDTINQELLPPEIKSNMLNAARQQLATAATMNQIKSNPSAFLQQVNAPQEGLSGSDSPPITTDENGLPVGAPKVTGLNAFDALTYEEQQKAINVAQQQERQNQVINRSDLQGRIQDANMMAVNGVPNPNPPTKNDFSAAYGDDSSTQWDAFQQQQQLNGNIHHLSTMTTAQQADLIKQYTPVPGEGYADQAESQTSLIKATMAVNKQRTNDPMTWAQQNNLAPNTALDFSNNDNFIKQIEQRAAAATAISKTYGLQSGVFNNNEATGMVNAMDQMGVQQKLKFLGDISDGLSDNPAIFRNTMAQVAPKDPVIAEAANYINADKLQVANPNYSRWSILSNTPTTIGVDGSTVAELALRGNSLISPTAADKETNGGGKAFPLPPDNADTGKAGLRNSFDIMAGSSDTTQGGIFNGTPQAAEQAYKTYKSVYAAMASDAGNYSGVVDPVLAAKAANYTLGDVTEINGKKVAPPWGMSASDFNDVAKSQYLAASENIPNAPKWGGIQLQNLDTPGQYAIRAGSGFLSSKGRTVIIDLNNPLAAPTISPQSNTDNSPIIPKEGSF